MNAGLHAMSFQKEKEKRKKRHAMQKNIFSMEKYSW
jgi:hypothetical protein